MLARETGPSLSGQHPSSEMLSAQQQVCVCVCYAYVDVRSAYVDVCLFPLLTPSYLALFANTGVSRPLSRLQFWVERRCRMLTDVDICYAYADVCLWARAYEACNQHELCIR